MRLSTGSSLTRSLAATFSSVFLTLLLTTPTPGDQNAGSSLQPANQPSLTPIDQRVADLSPLNTSLRQVPPDLRQPSGFDRVYQIQSCSSCINGQYARVSGGLAAVFARSQYTPTRNGVRIDVPAGTIFQIGPLTAPSKYGYNPSRQTHTPTIQTLSQTAASSRAIIPQFDTQAITLTSLRSNPQPFTPHKQDAPRSSSHRTHTAHSQNTPQITERDSIFTSESYRASRLASLLLGTDNHP